MMESIHEMFSNDIAEIIRCRALNTRVEVLPPHQKVAIISVKDPVVSGKGAFPGGKGCFRVEMHTEDSEDVAGWLPDGALREDILLQLKAYLGTTNYTASLYLTLPTRLLPRVRTDEPGLFLGYMIGLTEDNRGRQPQQVRMKVGELQ